MHFLSNYHHIWFTHRFLIDFDSFVVLKKSDEAYLKKLYRILQWNVYYCDYSLGSESVTRIVATNP